MRLCRTCGPVHAGACDADAFAEYETWMEYDLAWLGACEALLRLPGHSPGADREVRYALGREEVEEVDHEIAKWQGDAV